MSSNSCFNSDCNVSNSETWKKGWRLRNFGFANLCNSCGCIYEEGRFCETFHKYATGWRCCEACGKQVHCGCIVSINTFIVLDAGGIECIVCARNNLTREPNQMCPPHYFSGQLTQPFMKKWSQDPCCGSNGFWNFGENVLIKPAYVNLGSKTSFEADMTIKFERLFLSEHGAAFPSERNQIQNWSFRDRNQKDNDTENPGYVGAGKQLCAKTHNVDSSHHCQQCNLKPAEVRVRKDLLSQYTPKPFDAESQQISESTQSVITPLFEKRLSASDVSKVGRLVIPKKCAEMHFPPISQSEGLPIKVQDVKGKEWIFLFRFWLSNHSRIYVLERINACIRSLQLLAGDTVSFGRREPEGMLILGFKKATTRPQSDQGTLAVKNGNQVGTIHGFGSRSPKLKQELNMRHPKATGRSSCIPVKRKKSMVISKRKHSRVDSVDYTGLKVTLEEMQGLFRSPLSHAPRVVIIEDFELEEYEDAPVIGRPTMIVGDSMGKEIQWTQCDSCLKWRKLPFDSLLPAKFTCADNVWDNKRSSCEIAQELSVKQLKVLLSTNNTEPSGAAGSKKLQDVELDVPASEDFELLDNSTIEAGLASSQSTTKHPRHKNGCSCVVCCQPPSGGPKHQPYCKCNICMMQKRRLQTIMIRRKKTQPKKGVIQKVKSQTMAISSEKSNPAVDSLKTSCKGRVNADKKVICSSIKSQIVLNT